jgi:RNA polymerase sigma-70 factor (ECF subfamily)
MRQVRAGDRAAAGVLIDRNRARIVGYIARLIHDRRTAEDLAHDVLLQALRYADQYNPAVRVSTWLYRIATNTALNYLRRADHQRRATGPAASSLEVVDHHELAPDQQLRLDELKQHVSQALVCLPINQRIALVLFEYEECSYAQIATILDVSAEAVRGLLTRARTALRRTLGKLS